MGFMSRAAFVAATVTLMAMAMALIGYGVFQVFVDPGTPPKPFSTRLLNGIGYVVIATAVFDVAKFLLEEEGILRDRDPRRMDEARRSLTKFITIITIAVFLEALVMVFEAGKAAPLSNMIYPTLLLLAGVGVLLGLGLFQRLSADAERKSGEESAAAQLPGDRPPARQAATRGGAALHPVGSREDGR
jgi:hypothetical protein